jgi:hypothetical protein
LLEKPLLCTHHGALNTKGNLQVSTTTRGLLLQDPNMIKASSKLETLKDSNELDTKVEDR